MRAGDVVAVDFHLDLPELYATNFSFSPAIANGTLDTYTVCDWIDNACAIEVVQKTTTYGYIRVPTKVSAYAVTGESLTSRLSH